MLEIIITAMFSSLFGALASIVATRLSKTRAERDSGLASDYLKIADMSGDQLEKKINQIDQLDKRIEELKRENTNLSARITKMQLEETERERAERERNKAIADKIQGLEDYIKTLIDVLRQHHLEIPPRPPILKDRETLDKIRTTRFPIKPGETS